MCETGKRTLIDLDSSLVGWGRRILSWVFAGCGSHSSDQSRVYSSAILMPDLEASAGVSHSFK